MANINDNNLGRAQNAMTFFANDQQYHRHTRQEEEDATAHRLFTILH